MSHLEFPFFGLQPSDKEAVILEPTFLLMYYCGFSYKEVQDMPVIYKRWFIERVSKEISKSGENGEASASRAAHHNSPDTRALQGRMRQNVPSKLRRFS